MSNILDTCQKYIIKLIMTDLNAYIIEELEFIDEQMPSVYLLSYHTASMNELSIAKEAYDTSQQYRFKSLTHYKNSGEFLIKIREALRGATREKPIVSDIGTFNSFEHYMQTFFGKETTTGLKRAQARNYMRLAENWDVVEDLKLQDSQACYRLVVTLKIISWGIKKREAGYNLKELDHHLYFEELQNQASNPDQTGELSKPQLKALVEELREKLDDANLEVLRLRRQLSLEESFAL